MKFIYTMWMNMTPIIIYMNEEGMALSAMEIE